MIYPIELRRVFNRHHILGIFHDAQNRLVAFVAGANGTNVFIGNIMACRAELDSCPQTIQGFSQRQIVLAYYLFCSFFGLLTLITTSRLFKFVAFSMMVLLIMAGFALLARYGHQAESPMSS